MIGKIDIWDTSGNPNFYRISRGQCSFNGQNKRVHKTAAPTGKAVVFMFDDVDMETFDLVEKHFLPDVLLEVDERTALFLVCNRKTSSMVN